MRSGFGAAILALFGLGLAGCSTRADVPTTGAPSLAQPQGESPPAAAKATQYLYVYNEGSAGLYTGEYARYSLPDLSLLETTEADGVASPEAFGKDQLPYFIDEAAQGGFAVYLQPVKNKVVPAVEQFYGVPCQSTSLATGPTGDFYAVQYCSGNVLEYSPKKATNKAKKPIAQYTGGNLGLKSGTINPTYAAVDRKGDLYVGDNEGGVTYFAAGSTKGVIAFPTGNSGYVYQMIVDANGDVWSVHGPDPTQVYFRNKTSCVPDRSGTIERFEQAERFSKGRLVQHLYTATSDSPVFAGDGLSIAIDSKGRIYIGNQDSSDDGVLLDYNPGASCPTDGLSFVLPTRAFPQVAVDASGRYYITDYNDNSISVYEGGSKKLLKKITQKKGIVAITYATIGP
ncbi:MAG TPA: hypothetical protein VKR56_00150 [Candidatus Cybelea sp.]|nr:hypothetical protein [Candidatus Cybelea sp.]